MIPGALALACNSPASEIRIGVLVGEAGRRAAASGLGTTQAAGLAEQMINASGGIVVHGVPHRVRVMRHRGKEEKQHRGMVRWRYLS